MHKQITACILLAAFSLQMLSKGLVYIDYYTNTFSYAKNCINKTRPQMHCNGKCQMMKKLQQEEKKDSQVPPERKSAVDDVISSRSFFATPVNCCDVQAIVYNDFVTPRLCDMPRSCFHPPGTSFFI